METKDDFLARLRSDPLYKRALETAKDDATREKIRVAVEGFVSSYAEALVPIIQAAKNDPEYAQQLRQVMTGVEPVVTGSSG